MGVASFAILDVSLFLAWFGRSTLLVRELSIYSSFAVSLFVCFYYHTLSPPSPDALQQWASWGTPRKFPKKLLLGASDMLMGYIFFSLFNDITRELVLEVGDYGSPWKEVSVAAWKLVSTCPTPWPALSPEWQQGLLSLHLLHSVYRFARSVETGVYSSGTTVQPDEIPSFRKNVMQYLSLGWLINWYLLTGDSSDPTTSFTHSVLVLFLAYYGIWHTLTGLALILHPAVPNTHKVIVALRGLLPAPGFLMFMYRLFFEWQNNACWESYPFLYYYNLVFGHGFMYLFAFILQPLFWQWIWSILCAVVIVFCSGILITRAFADNRPDVAASAPAAPQGTNTGEDRNEDREARQRTFEAVVELLRKVMNVREASNPWGEVASSIIPRAAADGTTDDTAAACGTERQSPPRNSKRFRARARWDKLRKSILPPRSRLWSEVVSALQDGRLKLLVNNEPLLNNAVAFGKKALIRRFSSTPMPDESSEKKDPTCVICLSAPPIIMVQPCGHLCLCESCRNAMSRAAAHSSSLRKCPLCNEPATGTQRVFFA